MKVQKIEKSKEDLRIVFMGTPDYALETLKALVENKYNVVAVYSQPDKPKGRGMQMQMTETKEYAIEKNIPVYQPDRLKNEEALEIYKSLKPDLTIVVAYGKILPKSFLDVPEYGCINVHGSLLPAYRGAAPIQWSIINGDTKTGITTMFMDIGMVDNGDMLEVDNINIEETDTYETLYNKSKVVGAKTMLRTLDKYFSGDLERTVQSEDYTLAPRILKEDMRLDFSKTTRELDCMVRGTNPMPCAHAILIDENNVEQRFKILEVVNVEKESTLECGEIYSADAKEGLIVKTGDGHIQIKVMQAPNSKKMTAEEYLRGKKIKGRFKC